MLHLEVISRVLAVSEYTRWNVWTVKPVCRDVRSSSRIGRLHRLGRLPMPEANLWRRSYPLWKPRAGGHEVASFLRRLPIKS
jgi:hypothetical protein